MTQLIHVVGPECTARMWLVHTLVRTLTALDVRGTLVDVLDAEANDNEALRANAQLGRVAIVVAESRSARHCDLQGEDVVLSLAISPYAQQLADEVRRLEERLSAAQCAYVIEQVRR